LPLAEIIAAGGLAAEEARAALKLLCLRGTVLYDIARAVYRPRALLPQALDVAELRYGSPREARAHRLLGDGSPGQGEVKLLKVHEIAGEGTVSIEIHGEVLDREARRTYATHFTVDNEGRVKDAACTCPLFRRSGLREGPCEHLLALRLAQARRRAEEEALRQTPEGQKLIRAETRTLIRRESEGQESVYRVSLDARVVRLVWGQRANPTERQQRLWFDSDREARAAYFARLSDLAKEGFIDAGSMADIMA
ncbi:MAG TPA: SWIM zinc finger domain-containing protein, partial [Pseudomonadota bacterium]|nr:SWIM zinc finger domain-containing protein [Pseudomonadota bacterium]